MRRLVIALCLLPCLVSLSARAGRALVEEPGIGRVAARAPRAAADAALGAAGLSDTCARQLKADGLAGLECRALVALASMQRAPIASTADVDARMALAADFVKSAASVRVFEPLAPAPGFASQRFATHRALARAAMALLDEVNALPRDHAARQRADALLAGPPRRMDDVCVAVRGSLELAGGADASLEERGTLQALLTSHRCFLDESRLVAAPRPGEALKNNADANAVKSKVGDAGLLRQYAEARAIDLERCTKKLTDAAGRPTDAKKLEECTCGVVKRWTFPARATETRASLPIGTLLHLVVTVGPAGRATACGPLGDAPVPQP